MAVVCVICGQLSQDPEFCDHCNSDLLPAAERLPPPTCPLPDGPAELTPAQRGELIRVEAAVHRPDGGPGWRVHWVPEADMAGWLPRLERRLAVTCPALAPGRLRPDPLGVWVFLEAGAGPWAPWDRPPPADPVERLAACVADVRRLARALADLHARGLVCLPFDPRALEEGPPGPDGAPGPLRFTNLDVEVFPAGAIPETVRVQRNFIPPEVAAFRPPDVGPATDVFHLALFAYYWLAGLLPDGFPGAGLEAFDYALPFLRVYAPAVPEGVGGVLARALAPDPAGRPPTPAALVAELDACLDRARGRRAFAGRLAWDVGGHSRIGKAKAAAGRENEDQVLIRLLPEDDAALVAVADGISTCHVGSGALASLLTIIMLEATFAFGSSHDRFPDQATQACRQAAQSILEWALEKGYRSQLALGLDLMGTTLTVGWLQGRQLSLANLGDSRAYLITADDVEQLTVDGDLASALLSRRVPPEEVRALGIVGRSLRECVGGCVLGPDGEPQVMPESGHPAVAAWPLVPGDVVVLCTDGLVEEGIFLEPETLAELVRRDRDRPAGDLAATLTAAADDLQRLPSALDPDGLGDNISCVVIKITAAGT